MSKRLIKIISLFLAAITAISLCAVSVSAETAGRFEYYCAIGTSITNAATLPGGGEETWTDGGFPSIIKEAYGIQNGAFFGRNGWRTTEFRVLLEDDYTGDDFTKYYWGRPVISQYDTLSPACRTGVKNADLITIELGSNELQGAMRYALHEFFYEHGVYIPDEDTEADGIMTLLSENRDGIVDKILAVLSDVEIYDDLITYLTKSIAEGMLKFYGEWDKMIEDVLKTNENDAQIYVIGMYNPISEFIKHNLGEKYTETLSSVTEKVIEPMIKSLNFHMAYGCKYAREYTYVDISGIPLYDSADGSHPGYNGHRYIAERLALAIEENVPCCHDHTVTVGKINPTRFSLGFTGTVICKDCGKIMSAGRVVRLCDICTHADTRLIGHINATRWMPGYTGDVVCTHCGKVVEKGSIIPRIR